MIWVFFATVASFARKKDRFHFEIVGPPLVGVSRSVGTITNLLNTKKAKNRREDRQP